MLLTNRVFASLAACGGGLGLAQVADVGHARDQAGAPAVLQVVRRHPPPELAAVGAQETHLVVADAPVALQGLLQALAVHAVGAVQAGHRQADELLRVDSRRAGWSSARPAGWSSSAARQRMRNIGAACTTARMRSSSGRARVGVGRMRRRRGRSMRRAPGRRPCARAHCAVARSCSVGASAQHRGPEAAALRELAGDGDVAAHHAAQPAADRQAEPGAAVLARRLGLRLHERLEQAADLLRRHADAGVGHFERHERAAVVIVRSDLLRA